MAFPAQFNLSNLDGSNGFVLNGIAAGDFSGVSVSKAGDINGDGFDDLIIGADDESTSDNSGLRITQYWQFKGEKRMG